MYFSHSSFGSIFTGFDVTLRQHNLSRCRSPEDNLVGTRFLINVLLTAVAAGALGFAFTQPPAVAMAAILALGGAEPRERLLRTLRILGDSGPLELLHGAGELRVLPLLGARPGRQEPLVFGLFIAVVTIVAAMRFPAFLEIVLLHRLDLTAGSRYAVTTLSR